MASNDSPGKNNGAVIGFEAKLWLAADKLRNNMDAAEYKHVVLGLIFLKYISDVRDIDRLVETVKVVQAKMRYQRVNGVGGRVCANNGKGLPRPGWAVVSPESGAFHVRDAFQQAD
jgi:hypothetical protein